MVKQGKTTKKYFETFRMFLRNFQDFVRIESFTKELREKLRRNFKLIPRKFHKTL